MDIKEVSKATGLSDRHIRRLIKSGEIKATKTKVPKLTVVWEIDVNMPELQLWRFRKEMWCRRNNRTFDN